MTWFHRSWTQRMIREVERRLSLVVETHPWFDCIGCACDWSFDPTVQRLSYLRAYLEYRRSR